MAIPQPRRCAAIAIALASSACLVAVVCLVALPGPGLEGAPGGECGNRLDVRIECGDRGESAAPLGAFVSGVRADGGSYSEQLCFDEAGEKSVTVAAGAYFVTAQAPSVMASDGSVMASGEADAAWFPDGAGGTEVAELTYEPVEMGGMTDEELAEIAAASFVDGAAADEALERAKALRDAAPAPDLATPDIDGESPGDVPGPSDEIGGE